MASSGGRVPTQPEHPHAEEEQADGPGCQTDTQGGDEGLRPIGEVEDADAGEKVQDADEKVEAPATKKVRGREPKEDTVKLLQKIYSGGELDTLTELKAAKVALKSLDRQVARLTQAGKSADAVQANSVKVRRAILAGHEKLQLPVTKGIHNKKADAIKAIEAIVEDADALAEDGARERKRGDELEQKVAALEAELARLRGGAA